MITSASWLSWIGFEAFFVSAEHAPCYLIQIERAEMARRLGAGETLEHIVMGRGP